MFAKLLKHEWKSTGGLLSILSLGALGLGVLEAVLMHLMLKSEERLVNGEEAAVKMMPLLGTMMTFVGLALVVYGVGVSIFLLIRFYKNKFTDEGYLTFTLPVTSKQIFLSSAVYILIWQIISVLVVVLAAGMVVIFGIAPSIRETGGSMEPVGDLFEGILRKDDTVWNMILDALKMVASTVTMMTSITLGAVWAKRHKLLAAIGIYYGLNMVISTVTSLIAIIYMRNESTLSVGIGMEMVIQLWLLLGGFFLSTHLMEKKLNLP